MLTCKTIRPGIAASVLLILQLLVLSWVVIPASHDRDWRADYSRLPTIHVTSDNVYVQNLRNWSYAPDGSTSVQEWLTATITPQTLQSVQFIMEPFGNHPGIAHTMLGFRFTDGNVYIASIEARREQGEAYRPLQAALTPTYEYIYVWTTERDMFGNSEFFAQDELYVYDLALSPVQEQKLLQTVLQQTHYIAQHPQWYNTLLANCTNVLMASINKTNPGTLPFNRAWVFPGYADEYLYELGLLDTSQTLISLQTAGHVSPFIKTAYSETNPVMFSEKLRQLQSQ